MNPQVDKGICILRSSILHTINWRLTERGLKLV